MDVSLVPIDLTENSINTPKVSSFSDKRGIPIECDIPFVKKLKTINLIVKKTRKSSSYAVIVDVRALKNYSTF
jgi:hypothetical protein